MMSIHPPSEVLIAEAGPRNGLPGEPLVAMTAEAGLPKGDTQRHV